MKCLSPTMWSRSLITVIVSVAIAVTGSAGVAGALPYPPIPLIPAAAPAPVPAVSQADPADPGGSGDPAVDPSVRTAGGLVPQTLVNGQVDPGSFPIQAPTGGAPATSHADRAAPVAVAIGLVLLAAWVMITVRRRRTD